MKFTEKRKRRFRNLVIVFTIICATPLCEKGRILSGATSNEVFAGKEISCVIDLGNGFYSSEGLETGLHFELLNKFAEDNNCEVRIKAAAKGENYADSLRNGRIDILITHETDSIQDLFLSRRINGSTVWAVPMTADSELRQINNWISHEVASQNFEYLKSTYRNTYDPRKKAEKGMTSQTLSPYDKVIRKYASQLGWDWKLLASVIYQESKFAINSRSHRGAQGLMQVMPYTAESYGVADLLDPESNIKVGTSHLKRLQKIFRKIGLQDEELIKFTLAAYNAGEGRIIDCYNFARRLQVDNTRWEEIVKIIPLMREDSILKEPSVKLGKFKGHETIAYVDNIMDLYHAFTTICPES